MKNSPTVLFFDNHLIVLNKPAGMPSQPIPNSSELSAEEWAKEWAKNQYQKPGNVFLHAVHRIDRCSSGLLLLAKTSKSLSRLQESSREGEFSKTYFAIVEGILPKQEGVFEDWLKHDDFQAVESNPHEKGAKKSFLEYTLIRQKQNLSLVKVGLKTGRYHQIRFQFSKRGFPILGDKKYGSLLPLDSDAIALHHARLQSPHPITKESQTWVSFPPSNWPLFDPDDFCSIL